MFLWFKILTGDKSDNIPPVNKGIGKKTFYKIYLNYLIDKVKYIMYPNDFENLKKDILN